MNVCPHCDYHRAAKRATVPHRPSKAHAAIERLHREISRVSSALAKRTPLRAVLVLVLALLAIGGYVWFGESGLDARLKSLSAHPGLGEAHEHPGSEDAAAAEAARAKRKADTAAL